MTYEVDDLRPMARGVPIGTIVRRAGRLDTTALRALFAFASTADSARLDRSTSWPTLLWALLKRWGDHDFATVLGTMPEASRRAITHGVDRATATDYRRRFPRTWAMGPHDGVLIGDSVGRLGGAMPDPRRVYLPSEISQAPRLVPGSCSRATYPPRYEERGVSGRVVFEFVVDGRGRIERGSRRLAAATHHVFVAPSEIGLEGCEFVAGRLGDQPVRVRMRQVFEYTPGYLDRRTVHPSFVAFGRVQAQTEAVGVDYAFAVVSAMEGDSASLAALLDLPSLVDMSDSAFMTYSAVMDVVRQRHGDDRFARAFAALAGPARWAAAGPLSGVLGGGDRYPRSDSLIATALQEQSRARDAGEPDPPLSEGALPDERPERVEGTCAASEYPTQLWRAGIEGRARVSVVLDTTGAIEPGSAHVEYANHPAFAAAAVTVVLSCRYRPGRLNGRAVRVRVMVPVNYGMRH